LQARPGGTLVSLGDIDLTDPMEAALDSHTIVPAADETATKEHGASLRRT